MDLWIALISAGSALLGVTIGGLITFYTQRWAAENDLDVQRKSLAAALAAEIYAYLELMKRRQHVEKAQSLVHMARAGQSVTLRNWLSPDEKPLDPFPVFVSHLGNVGTLGETSFDLACFYTLIAGVRSTLIDAARGRYDSYTPTQMANMIEGEINVWKEAESLGRKLINRLRSLAF